MKSFFVVLEPVNHMYKVIEAASRAGNKVLVIHSIPLNPPAPYDAAIACIHATLHVSSWSDTAALLQAITDMTDGHQIGGTYAGMEITLPLEALLRAQHGLPCNAPEVIELVQNKGKVRGVLRECGLSNLRHLDEQQIRTLERWPFEGQRAFFKPVNGAGSAYVTRCSSPDDIARCLNHWDANNLSMPEFLSDYLRAGQGVFLEEEIVGQLMSLEGYVWNGVYTPIGLTSRDVLARDIAIEMGATFPYSTPRWQEIIAKVSAIHATLGINHGPTHTEIIVPRDDSDIELVEVNIRFVGADVLILINEAFAICFEDTLVDLAMGQTPRFQRSDVAEAYASVQYLLPAPGTNQLASIEMAYPEIIFSKTMRKIGSPLTSCQFQGDQIAGFIVRADSYREVTAVAQRIREQVKVNGIPLGDNPNNVIAAY